MIKKEMALLLKSNMMTDDSNKIKERVNNKKATFAELKAEAAKILDGFGFWYSNYYSTIYTISSVRILTEILEFVWIEVFEFELARVLDLEIASSANLWLVIVLTEKVEFL